MATAKQDERTAFWETYGTPSTTPRAVLRSRIYEARHLGAIRLERHRRGNTAGIRESYTAMAAILTELN
ncbi:hypothetical protein E1293_02565 [Actinomadura darangshiensis]|uniref:Uncharacterized protein n=1 Tax=Actinomadura darangshiensis TaxID=705336 RepID=A0A4R5C004_9ACTN|nr:hypothetical protein [Actinomadura darangshiensis]TDD91070.1 hypothetical protein E1293_02565 [Actinomadura darangshiensis]